MTAADRRVLLIAPVAEAGGSDRGLLEVVRSLSAAGWRCHVALPGQSPLAGEITSAGGEIHVVPMRRITRTGSPLRWAAYLAAWPRSVRRLTRLARAVGADVVYTNSLHSWYGWAVAARLRAPHVWHAREIVVQSPAALRLERFLVRHFADATVAMSEAIADQFRPGHVTVFYEAPNAAAFSPARAGAFRAAVGIPDDVPAVGAVGRIDTWKGFEVLLDAVSEIQARCPGAVVVIAGPPVAGKEAFAADLESRAASLDGVWWVGPRTDVPDLMADLDVFVLPSTTPEPYGLVLVEALTSGVPVVATGAGGPVEIARPLSADEGRLVDPGDPDALASAVSDLLPRSSSTERRRLRNPLPVPQSPGHVLSDLVEEVVAGHRPRSLRSRVLQAVKVFAGAVTLFVFPVGSKRRHTARETVRRTRNGWFRLRGRELGSLSPPYDTWLGRREPSGSQLAAQTTANQHWRYRPQVDVWVVPSARDGHVQELLGSLRSQSYERWELRPGSDTTTGGKSDRVSDSDSAADYILMVAPGAVLSPQALHLAVREMQSDVPPDVLYCDDDLLTPDGEHEEPFFKPGWSPELLLSLDYASPFLMVRRELVSAVGGLDPDRGGAALHDLLLRLSERTSNVVHVPEVLCSSRVSTEDTSDDAHVAAVQAALARRSLAASAQAGTGPGEVRVSYEVPDPVPHVAILIPTRDRLDLLRACIDSVRANTDYRNYSITVVDNDSEDPATLDYLRSSGLRVLPAPGPFNYSAIVNGAIERTEDEFVLTLNNDTLVADSRWLHDLVALGTLPAVGAVGCTLTFPSGTLQHQGIVIGHKIPAANVAFETVGLRLDGLFRSVREVSSVTGACCLMRRSAWKEIGGFDEKLTVAYNDVDYCLRLNQHGYKVLYTPHVSIVHDEHATRGAWHPSEDERIFRRRWGLDRLRGSATCDPFFSPHLTLGRWGWQLVADALDS